MAIVVTRGCMAPALAAVTVLAVLVSGALAVRHHAEVAATTADPTAACSGNGLIYPDVGVCECFQCFSGPTCANKTLPCSVVATGGNPLLFQDWWEQDPDSKYAINLETDYRTGYQFGGVLDSSATGFNALLEESIVALHEMVGNVNAKNKSIVMGTGCSLLIAASQYALAVKAGNTTDMTVFAKVPYYDGYKSWADLHTMGVSFSSDESLDPETVIEFVTVPNNPTGIHRTPFYNHTGYTVYDMVYNWPSLTNVTDNVDHDIMLFSLSKLSGHAGSRVGWAIVSDPEVAANMAAFVGAVEITTSIDSRYRAMRIINSIVAGEGAFFKWAASKMAYRWGVIKPLFDAQDRFSLESVAGQFYLWVYCNDTADDNCYDVFADAGVRGWAGPSFGASNKYVRIEMMVADPVFDIFAGNMEALLTASA